MHDDTLILIHNYDQQIINLKFLLICFKDMSGLSINYHNSKVIILGKPSEEQRRVPRILHWNFSSFPFLYLGLSMFDRRLTFEQWHYLVLKLTARVEWWIGRFLSSREDEFSQTPALPISRCMRWHYFLFKIDLMPKLTCNVLDSTRRDLDWSAGITSSIGLWFLDLWNVVVRVLLTQIKWALRFCSNGSRYCIRWTNQSGQELFKQHILRFMISSPARAMGAHSSGEVWTRSSTCVS